MRRGLTSHSAGRAPSISASYGLAALVAVAAILHATAAFANDSTASLDAGGFKLTFNPNISMETDDLFLSRDEVRVIYRFRNESDHDIATLVAFPLPVVIIGEEGNYNVQGRDLSTSWISR